MPPSWKSSSSSFAIHLERSGRGRRRGLRGPLPGRPVAAGGRDVAPALRAEVPVHAEGEARLQESIHAGPRARAGQRALGIDAVISRGQVGIVGIEAVGRIASQAEHVPVFVDQVVLFETRLGEPEEAVLRERVLGDLDRVDPLVPALGRDAQGERAAVHPLPDVPDVAHEHVARTGIERSGRTAQRARAVGLDLRGLGISQHHPARRTRAVLGGDRGEMVERLLAGVRSRLDVHDEDDARGRSRREELAVHPPGRGVQCVLRIGSDPLAQGVSTARGQQEEEGEKGGTDGEPLEQGVHDRDDAPFRGDVARSFNIGPLRKSRRSPAKPAPTGRFRQTPDSDPVSLGDQGQRWWEFWARPKSRCQSCSHSDRRALLVE